MNLKATAAVVTGAASGLGAATARHLAERGAVVFGLDLPSAIDTADPVGGVTLIGADVTSEDDVLAAITQAGNGPATLRVAVNCAGIAPSARIVSRRGPHDLALFRKTIDVNLVGTFNVMRLAADAMRSTEPDENGQRGVIVNTASIAAFEAQIGQIAYAASKAAVAGMTITAARDLAQYGIRVMTIAPGIVDTPMMAGFSDDVRAGLAASVPFPKRLAQSAEFADLVACVVEHDYLNGDVIRMDGALRMLPH